MKGCRGTRTPLEAANATVCLVAAAHKLIVVPPERVERMINGVVRQLEAQGEGDVPSERIGELVMEGLKSLDGIAYVRFASVYRNFREAKDFEEFLGKMIGPPAD